MWLTVKKYKGKGSVKISCSAECHFYEKYSNNLKIRYDLGLMPLYVYRVSGRGRLPYLFKPTKGFNNQIVYSQIYNIFARSIEEVPLQLKKQEFSGYVYKVYKYEKAIFNKDFVNDVNYYYLTQTDFDGKTKKYEIISIDNRLIVSELVRITNILGQDINLDTPGLKIFHYTDGTIIKRY